MTQPEEREVLKQAKQGSRESLGLLYDAHTPKLYGYLINTMRDQTLADDLLQTTWIKAIESLPRYEPRGSPFGSWLFAIARNVCREHWRSGKRVIPLEPEHDRADEREQPDTVFIERLLATLDETDRELIRLRYIADLPVSDIARVVGISTIAVRVRLHRIIQRLKKTFPSYE